MEGHDEDQTLFKRELHVKAFLFMLDRLPDFYQTEDTHRILLAYFAVSGLDILNALDQVDSESIINWVYRLQVLPSNNNEEEIPGTFYGFQGCPMTCFPDHVEEVNARIGGHLACTFCALCILKTMGDDLGRVHRTRILRTMKNLQQDDGSFTYVHFGAEADLRFVYCAVAICYMLNDWSGIDVIKALNFITSCQAYDGGFGLAPGAESHGGASYCAVSALKLMGRVMYDPLSRKATCSVIDFQSLLDWVVQKQTMNGGFQGRANKDADSCYSFWIGGLLKVLNFDDFFDHCALRSFLLTCQSEKGGFSKCPSEQPDLFHSFYGLCGFSLIQEPGLNSLCWELGITERAQTQSTEQAQMPL